MKKKRKFNNDTSMLVIDYAIMVDSLASEFFNAETGEYQPHFGNLNAMRAFYNTFYRDMQNDEPIVDALDMNFLVSDTDFITAFNDTITTCSGIQLDFANAYRDALDIVETRKTSVGRIFTGIQHGLENIIDIINPVMNEDGINKLFSVVQEMVNGNVNMSNIVKIYGKDVATDVKPANITQTGKVVKIDHSKK